MYTKLDAKIEALGFTKMESEEPENEFGVSYRRKIEDSEFWQRVDVLRIPEDEHIVSSYEDRLNNKGMNNVIGLTYVEMILFAKKLKEMKRKYKWE